MKPTIEEIRELLLSEKAVGESLFPVEHPFLQEQVAVIDSLLSMLAEREKGEASGEVKHIQEGFPKKGGQNQKPSSPRPITPPLGGGQGHANEEEKK